MSLRQKQWMNVGRAFEAFPLTIGLCDCMYTVIGNGRHYNIISSLLGEDELRSSHAAFWLNDLPGDHILCALFAYFMAAMTDAERDAIVEGL